MGTAATSPPSSSPPAAPGPSSSSSSAIEEADPARTPFHRRLARAARRADPDAAQSVLRDMASAGIAPGPRAVHACVVAAAAADDADGALDAMRRAHAAGLRPLPESYVALIHAFARVEDAAAARAVLASMARAVPDAREGWLALCSALFRAGLGDDAEAALLRGRRADGWQPDAEVYLDWIVWLCSEGGARGAKLAQFIFSKDMRAAGVEPDIRHANTLLAADAFLLSPNTGEKTLFAISDGAFGPRCRPNADSHAIVMEAHLEVIESAARKVAHRLSGSEKEARLVAANAAAGLNNSSGGGGGDSTDSDPVAAIFSADPANYTQRGLDEGSDGVGAGHEALDEALGVMLQAGISPNKRVHAAMTRAKLLGGAGPNVIMGFFRRMARLGKPGTRTELLPDETMQALVWLLSDTRQPWHLLEVVSAAADDGRELPAGAFGPRGVDAEALIAAGAAEEEGEAFAAAAEAVAAEEEGEGEGEGEAVKGFFGDDDDEDDEEAKSSAAAAATSSPPRQRSHVFSASSLLSPITDWIPAALAGATADRVPGGLVDFKAAAARARAQQAATDAAEDDGGGRGEWEEVSSAPSAFASSSTVVDKQDGVLIETLVDAQGNRHRRVVVFSSSGKGKGGGGGESDDDDDEGEGGSEHWVDADGAVVAVPERLSGVSLSSPPSSSEVGPGSNAVPVSISKMTRDQLVAELAARGLPHAGMKRPEQYLAVKGARAATKAGGGGASDLDDVAVKRELAALAVAAREAAKVSAAADESAAAAAADVVWEGETWVDGEVVATRAPYQAPPPWSKYAGEDEVKTIRLPGSGLQGTEKDEGEEEEEEVVTDESLLAEARAELAHLPDLFSIHDGDDDDKVLDMTAKEVNERSIARLISGVPDEEDSQNLSYGYPYGPNDPFADPPAWWPEDGVRVSELGLGLFVAVERCGVVATAADLTVLAAAAAGERDCALAVAVAERLGDGSYLRASLAPHVVEAVGLDLRRATRVSTSKSESESSGGGRDSAAAAAAPSSARAAVEAALAAAGIGSPSHSHSHAAAAVKEAGSIAAAAAEEAEEQGDEEEEEAARAEAVAAAVARAAAERAASPAPRLEGGGLGRSVPSSSSSAAAAAPAARKAAAAPRASDAVVASTSSSSVDEGEEEKEEGEEEEEEVVAAAELLDLDTDVGNDEEEEEEEGETDDDENEDQLVE